jgi:hypothetical protein
VLKDSVYSPISSIHCHQAIPSPLIVNPRTQSPVAATRALRRSSRSVLSRQGSSVTPPHCQDSRSVPPYRQRSSSVPPTAES